MSILEHNYLIIDGEDEGGLVAMRSKAAVN